MRTREEALPSLTPDLVGRLTKALGRSGRVLRRNPTMAAGLVVIFIMGLLALIAPLITPVDPRHLDPVNRLIAPSNAHWFGTDHLGRDLYTRTIFGSRVSLLVGFSVAILTMAMGVVLGLLSGYYPRVDMLLQRVMDGLMAIPAILLAIAMMAMLGASVQNVITSLVVVDAPRATRVVRASVLSLREQTFVDAARAIGTPPWRILAFHIFPNTIAPLIVQGTFICASAVIIEAYLSFLGAGTPPDIPSWGNIMAEGRGYIQRAIWIILFPGIALALTVLGINLVGDGLRDNLDPKLRRRL